MIKKLRKKFILINMIFVTLILMAVLIGICLMNYQKYREDSKNALSHALSEGNKSLMPKIEGKDMGKRPMNMGPVFVVTLDEEGNMSELNDTGIQITDEIARQAVASANEDGGTTGFLYNLQLRFEKQDRDGVKRVAFVDCSREINGMKNLFLVSALVFVGGLAAFFLISLFLARWALTPVETAWKQQKQFIADASHELKTPLTVILANLGILSSHSEDTIRNQRRWLENTKTEAGRMKKLLDNLLFLAKSDTAETPVVFSEFDLSSAIWSCILPFESLAYEQDAQLLEEITPDIHMTGDEGQLKQLIAILLDNACKFVKKKGWIRVTLERKQDKIVLEVSNTGEVIPEEDLSHIFERFYRADKSRARKEGGYGLGLSIAQTIVLAHHGKIKATSSKEQETVFTITFPVTNV